MKGYSFGKPKVREVQVQKAKDGRLEMVLKCLSFSLYRKTEIFPYTGQELQLIGKSRLNNFSFVQLKYQP